MALISALKSPWKYLWILVFMLAGPGSHGQTPATQASVVANFAPPYTIPIAELTTAQLKVIITAMNGYIDQGKISVLIQGNNGIRLQNNYATSAFNLIMMDANVYQLTDVDLQDIFDPGNFTATGITVANAFYEGLPPGSYEICFRVYVQGRTAFAAVSQPPPLGCSAFVIQDSPTAVMVSTIVQPPPFTPDLPSYLYKINATLHASDARKVRLFLSIKGDNGITVHSRQGVVTTAISLDAGVPYVLDPMDLEPYFRFENLAISGISANAVYNYGLPEGNYRFCIRAVDINGNFVSADDPLGCSNLVTIKLLEPPQLIAPACGSSIPATATQNIVFSWSVPPGAPPGVAYTLRIVEMIDTSKDPNDAMFTATTPAFFEETVVGSTGFLYGPAQPLLEPGRKYAWQVIAGLGTGLDMINSTSLFKNNGKSAVCSFLYDAPPASGGLSSARFEVTIPGSGETMTVGDSKDFYIAWGWWQNRMPLNNMPGPEIDSYELVIKSGIKEDGKKTDNSFQYQTTIAAAQGSATIPKHFQKSAQQAASLGFKDDHWYAIQVKAIGEKGNVQDQTPVREFRYADEMSTVEDAIRITGTMLYRFDGHAESYPIPNTSIRIRKAFLKPVSSGEQALSDGQAVYSKTTKDGKFDMFVPLETLGDGSPGDSLRFHLDIISPYYKTVTKIFSISADADSVKVGHVITSAFSYTLKLYVEKAFSDYYITSVNQYYDYKSNKIVEESKTITYVTDVTVKEIQAGIPVMIYRKSKPGYLPPKEGQVSNTTLPAGQSYIPVALGETAIEIGTDGKKRGYVVFNRLLCNVKSFAEDIYYIRAIDEKATGSSSAPAPYQEAQYEAPEMQFSFEKPDATDSTHFKVEATYEILSKDPPKSHLSGQLVYQWPSDKDKVLRPLANAHFEVVAEYLFNGKPVVPLKWGSQGAFEATSLTLEGEETPVELYDAGVVMATGQTDEDGRFSLDVVNLNAKGSLGMGTENKKSNKGIEIPKEAQPKIKNLLIDPSNPSELIGVQQLSSLNQSGVIDFMNLDASMSMQAGSIQNTLNSGNKVSPSMNLGAYSPFSLPRMEANQQDLVFHQTRDAHGPNAYWYSGTPKRAMDNIESTGTIERVYRIRIGDKSFYYDPEANIVVDAFKAKDTGPITVMVKELKWNVGVTDKNTNVLKGMKAVVFREPASKVKGMPEGEGDQQYRIKKLINPQFTGEVTLPPKEQSPAQTKEQVQWQPNSGNMKASFDPSTVLKSDESWSQGEYEWLADTETNEGGVASFGRLLRGFYDYYVEVTSNPATGSQFYEANIKPLTFPVYSVGSNTEYAGYWDTRKVDVPEIIFKVEMEPYPSRVAGRVIDKSSGLGMGQALVLLLDSKENLKKIWLTKSDGYFEFLNVVTEGSNLTYSVKVFHKGYKQENPITNNTVSKTGQQMVYEVLMVPSATITGIVKNEQGQPIEAYVKREDGLVVTNQKPGIGKLSLPGTVPGKFELPAPDGSDVTFYVIPKDVGYFPDTITVKPVKKGVNDLQTVTVFRRKHRMNFVVTNASNTQLRIQGARLFINKEQQAITDSDGKASFSFENVSVNNYTVHVLGPEGLSFVPQVLNVKNEETEAPVTYVVKLKKGGVIAGVVRLDGQPVAGARVYLDYQQQSQSPSSSNYALIPSNIVVGKNAPQSVIPEDAVVLKDGTLPAIETYTDAQGTYKLNGIPINSGTVTVFATLDTTFTVIGDQHQVTLANGQGQQDLFLKKFSQMEISSLYGFPFFIESIIATGDKNTVKVTGLVKLVATSDFDLSAATATQFRVRDVPFELKTIQNHSVGIPVPASVKAEAVSSLKLQYLDRYNVMLQETVAANEELTLTRTQDGKGSLDGYVQIVDNSFDYPSSYLNFTNKDDFFLGEVINGTIENNVQALRSIQADGEVIPYPKVAGPSLKTNQTSKKYYLCNADKKPVSFQFINFAATADPLNSYIDPDGRIHLDINMNCKIPNAKPEEFEVNIKDVVLDNNKVYAATGSAPLVLKLEEWDVEVKDWTIDPQKGGIYSTTGLIKTEKLEVPFNLFNLRADMFVMDQFQLSKIQIGGGIRLLEDIAPGSALLVYDTKVGSDMSPHWKLSITGKDDNPAARIKGLSPHLSKNLEIAYIQLLSNNEDILTIKQSEDPAIVAKNALARFTPATIFSGLDFFSVTGSLSIPAPRIDPFSVTLTFSGSPSLLKMNVEPVQMDFEAKGYVQFISDPGEPVLITQEQIVIQGSVEEPEKFNSIPSTFFAVSDGAGGQYRVDAEEQYKLNLTEKSNNLSVSGFNLLISEGGMKVEGNDWNLLSFTGRLFKGNNPNSTTGNIKDNVLTFTVHGDVQVDGKKMKVNNIPDLPGFTMVYEFENQRLIGNLSLDGLDIGAGLSASIPVAEILFDPTGWYFGAGGEIKNAPVIGSFNAGIIIGEYALNNTLKQIITQYSVTNDLCDFNNQIKGFFVTGGKPLIDESIGYNFVVTSGYYNANVGLEASFLMAFGSSPTYNLKMGAYGIVEASISSLTCTKISGSIDVRGIVEAGYINGGFEGGADVSMFVATSLEQGLPDLSDCTAWTTVFDKQVCAGFSLKVGKSGFTPAFSLSCSEENDLTCK